MIDVELIGAPAFTVAVADGAFTYAAINARLAAVIGVAPADFSGQTPETLVSPAYAAELIAHYRRCVAERASVDFESYYDAPGGGRWWHTVVTPVLDGEGGRVSLLIGVAVDVTPRKQAERRDREAQTRAALAMEVLEGGFWHHAIASGRLFTSPQLSRLVTGAEAALDGSGFAAFVPEEDRAALDIGPLLRGEIERGAAEYRLRTADRGLRWMSCTRRLTRDEAGRPESVIGVVVDVTAQKARQALLASEAATDSLTGLLNRRGFDRVGEARRRGRGFGLLLLDLDRFKPVNDAHGHAAGDAVLREVAARLRAHTRPGDAVARLGGDEFALLVDDVDPDALAALSCRLIEALSRPFATPAGPVAVGASLGVAAWREGDGSLAALVSRADAVLFEVKRAGRGAWRIAA